MFTSAQQLVAEDVAGDGPMVWPPGSPSHSWGEAQQ